MRLKLLAVFAIAALVTGCETPTSSSGEVSGSGSTAAGAAGAPTTGVATSPLAVQEELVRIGDRVFFAVDKFALDTTARATIEQQAAFLAANPSITVMIEGHADERGTREYNLALGDRRANAVRDFMVSLGIAPTRVQTISYGEERPDAAGSNEAAWAKNRRAVTVVTGGRIAAAAAAPKP